MPRIDKLEDVLFEVAEHPVFVSVKSGAGERRLPVPSKKAIVSWTGERVIGIVGQDYRLVSNREAFEMAHQCCRTVFPETKAEEWGVTATDAPSTGGYCHIDLAHNTAALDFNAVPAAERPEVYGPFIRVTNSYNGLRALSFDIGFYRKVCTNGLILPDTIIRFRYNHQRRHIGDKIQFEVSRERLAKFKTGFSTFIEVLRNFEIERSDFEPLVLGVLALRQPAPLQQDSRLAADWRKLSAEISSGCDHYSKELGENAYAVFNAVTEFASHAPANRCVHRDRNSLQRLAGSWLATFSHDCQKPGFSVGKYLDELAKPDDEAGTNGRRN